MLRYLEYSGIKNVESEELKDGVLISVGEEQFEEAMTFLKVYVREHMEESNEDDYYFDEYETEIVDVEAKVSDMKSTVYTFGFVGLASVVIAILNYFDILVIGGFDKTMLTIILGVIGLLFLGGVALKTNFDIADASNDGGEEKEHQINNIFNWYKDEKDFETFFKRHRIKRDEVDEGALYFFCI